VTSRALADRVARFRLAQRLDQAVAALPTPPATPTYVVDLDAFDRNAEALVRRAAGKPVRVATKSLRVPALLERALATPGFAGVLAYTLREALWVAERDLCPDVLLGYPSVDRPALARLAGDERLAGQVCLMVDGVEHLDLVDAVRPRAGPPVRVAVDIDAGLRVGRARLGPRRSPLFEAEDVVALVAEVRRRPGFTFAGVMTYEGQVAGVPDRAPRQPVRTAAIRGIKRASVAQLHHRRRMLARRLRQDGEVGLWNAGGTGSLETSAADPVVTEVTAGSGLLGPHLFDGYRKVDADPAAFFGLRVVRRPGPDTVTVAGGGLIASGPPGPDRAPQPWSPPGLHLTPLEGAGEVQTPLRGPAAGLLEVGDLVWFRHAKAGEPSEHTGVAHLLQGRQIIGSEPTYRGLGLCW
jgi:D-serine deaminase-like pyridoxal phosphate-dependent protein